VRKKIVWMLVSFLMVLSLVIASCAPEEVEEKKAEEKAAVVVKTEEKAVAEKVAEEKPGLLPPEVPKYGGTLTIQHNEPMGFDPAYTLLMECRSYWLTVEELMRGDWTKGPAGSGETGWVSGFLGLINLETGSLAESWELPDNETIIFHIRKGVHWHNKPPANGREFVASDAAWSIMRSFTTPTSYHFGAYSAEKRPKSARALDKYTLEVKVPAEMQGLMLLVCGDFLWMNCPDVVQQYGDMKDWRNSIGTGPFILKDYVPGSLTYYERNPNYWMKDPLHPENQLPYLDSVKILYITDLSTQLAALRTGKLDRFSPISWDNAELLQKQCPELKYRVSYGMSSVAFRMDKPELPFKDLRVRRALSMAINREEMVKEYYGGHAIVYSYPYYPLPDFSAYYVPWDELPESAKEPFTYNPEKARQLLKEAGYPEGFKTKVVCGSATEADFLSVIKEYLADIKVDMEIQQLESSIFRSLSRARKHEEGIIRGNLMTFLPFRLLEWRIESFDNHSFFESERIRRAYDAINAAVGKNDAEVSRQLRDLVPYMLEQCIQIWCPAYEQYTMWWPWMQNYHGEITVGYDNEIDYPTYVWVDKALKKSMGY